MELQLIIQVSVIGILTTLLAMAIKNERPEFALILALGGSLVIFFLILPSLSAVVGVLKEISDNLIISSKYVSIILKVIAIAYIAEFAAQTCVDDGESAIASKIELAGKILIMYVSAPILLSLIDVVINMLP